MKRYKMTAEEYQRVKAHFHKLNEAERRLAALVVEVLNQQTEERNQYWEQVQKIAGITDEEHVGNTLGIEWVTGEIILRPYEDNTPEGDKR